MSPSKLTRKISRHLFRIRDWFVERTPADWIVICLCLVFTIGLSYLKIQAYHHFITGARDAAKFDQAIWNTSQGRPYEITLFRDENESNVNQGHFSPALALYAPLYWIWSDMRMLLITQVLLMTTSGLFVYAHLRKKNEALGVVVYLAYTANHYFHQVALGDFRRWTLAVFMLSWAFYLMLNKNYKTMLIPLLIALLSKEDMPLAVIAFGVFLCFKKRNPTLGAALIAIGVLYMIIVPSVVLPALWDTDGYFFADKHYSYLGNTPQEMINTLIQSPGAIFTYALKPDRLLAFWRLAWPLAFIFLLAPEVCIAVVPYVAYTILSRKTTMGTLGYHYPTIILLYLIWAVGIGIQRIPKKWQQIAATVLVCTSIFGWFQLSQFWPGEAFDSSLYEVTDHDRLVMVALRDIPDDASVTAQYSLVPHLSHRKHINLLTSEPIETEYLVIDKSYLRSPLSNDEYKTFMRHTLSSIDYSLVQQIDDEYYLLKLVKATPKTPTSETWGGFFTLSGYSTDIAVPESDYQLSDDSLDQVRINLFWRLDTATDIDVNVRVVVLDENDDALAKHQWKPVGGSINTSTLVEGQELRDIHVMELENAEFTDLSSLSFRLFVGDTEAKEYIKLSDGSTKRNFDIIDPDYVSVDE